MQPHHNTNRSNNSIRWLQPPARCPTRATWTCKMQTAPHCQMPATHLCRQTSPDTPAKRSKTSFARTASTSSFLTAAKWCCWTLSCQCDRPSMRCMSKGLQLPVFGMRKQRRWQESSAPATSSTYCGACAAMLAVVLIHIQRRRWTSLPSEVLQSNTPDLNHVMRSGLAVMLGSL